MSGETIGTFLRHQYGATEGIAYIGHQPVGGRFGETAFLWPSESDKMVRAIVQADDEGDVWYCSHLMQTGSPSRSKASAIGLSRLHVDLDREPTDGDVRKAFELLDCWAVSSGSEGHLHLYVELDREVTLDEYEVLSRGLVALFGDVDSKIAPNDLLRIPGTRNHKHDPPTAVVLGAIGVDAAWDDCRNPNAVERLRRTVLPHLQSPERIDVAATGFTAVDLTAYPAIEKLVTAPAPEGVRSDRVAQIVNATADAGLTPEQAAWSVKQSPAAVRFDGSDTRLLADVSRIYGTNYEEVRRQTERPMFDAIREQEAATLAASSVPLGQSSWAPQSFDDVLDGTVTSAVPTMFTRSDGFSLLYPGMTHSFFGEFESGKSLLAQLETVNRIKAGEDVLYIDFESNRVQVVSRLRLFGATPRALRAHLTYVRPRDSLKPAGADWNRLLERNYALAVIDGVTNAMALTGHDIISNGDISLWFALIPDPLADKTGAAVVMIDHVTKGTEGRGRAAIGGQHKMSALSGAGYMIEPVELPKPGARGVISMRVAKDRDGLVRENSGEYRKTDRTQQTARVTIDSTDKARPRFYIDPPFDQPEVPALEQKKADVWNFLGNTPSANKGAIKSAVGGKGTTVDDALAWLTINAYLTLTKAGRAHEYSRTPGKEFRVEM